MRWLSHLHSATSTKFCKPRPLARQRVDSLVHDSWVRLDDGRESSCVDYSVFEANGLKYLPDHPKPPEQCESHSWCLPRRVPGEPTSVDECYEYLKYNGRLIS